MTPQQAIEKYHPEFIKAFDFSFRRTGGDLVPVASIEFTYESLNIAHKAASFWAEKLYGYCGAPPPIVSYSYYCSPNSMSFGETLYSDPADKQPAHVTD